MSRPLGLIELVTRVGEDNVRIQNVVESLAGAKLRKGGVTALSFYTLGVTPTELMTGDCRNVGLVLWMPRELVDKALADHNRPVVHPDDATPERPANWQGPL